MKRNNKTRDGKGDVEATAAAMFVLGASSRNFVVREECSKKPDDQP